MDRKDIRITVETVLANPHLFPEALISWAEIWTGWYTRHRDAMLKLSTRRDILRAHKALRVADPSLRRQPHLINAALRKEFGTRVDNDFHVGLGCLGNLRDIQRADDKFSALIMVFMAGRTELEWLREYSTIALINGEKPTRYISEERMAEITTRYPHFLLLSPAEVTNVMLFRFLNGV